MPRTNLRGVLIFFKICYNIFMEEKKDLNVEKYIKALQWAFLVVLIFEICALFLDYSWILFWTVQVAFYIFVVYRLSKEKIGNIAWIGVISTFLLSFTTAFIELLMNFRFWYIFSLITQPIIDAVIGALVISLFYLVYNKLIKSKGGGENAI